MADINISIGSIDPVSGLQRVVKYKDMGNGTWAEVLSGITTGPGVGADDLLLETGDHMLLETGDAILME